MVKIDTNIMARSKMNYFPHRLSLTSFYSHPVMFVQFKFAKTRTHTYLS